MCNSQICAHSWQLLGWVHTCLDLHSNDLMHYVHCHLPQAGPTADHSADHLLLPLQPPVQKEVQKRLNKDQKTARDGKVSLLGTV
jgi:hypothetical protein